MVEEIREKQVQILLVVGIHRVEKEKKGCREVRIGRVDQGHQVVGGQWSLLPTTEGKGSSKAQGPLARGQ